MLFMLDREEIFALLRDNNLEPVYLEGSKTVIETNRGEVFYVLQYSGDCRIGWTLSYSVLKELKSYAKATILLINSGAEEIFILGPRFFNTLQPINGCYKIDRNQVESRKISFESFDDYL
ncbi:hypothetical protein [Desulfosporosinus sp. BG]|uniref:hypothetical protein n=1 Tax=Desulfosporosinus sp. BG TaxID=1633135 RepID=UPI00083ACA89|nr:hypothetical protein [Desulfosporosinus sp. BG]ODA41592.1 hypothetical protein DSBG_1521 [Desulfosporosinus sp. BG]